MPLIIITGLPASGKTHRASQIQHFFESRGKTVYLVSEMKCIQSAGFDKNECYRDSEKEKFVRSNVKSEVLRLLNKDELVIIDGGNYIKGHRYEIFCASKASRTLQCTMYCAIVKEQAWKYNSTDRYTKEIYQKDVFDALCIRYEEPQCNNRWDSPLFTIFPEDDLDVESMYDALFTQKALLPNQSTQNPPLSSTNFLFEMDKITQNIIDRVQSARKLGLEGPVKITGDVPPVDVPSEMNASCLNRYRRQFLNYMKMHKTGASVEKIPSLFVHFLNSNCK